MRKTISTATTTVTSPAWTFAPDSVTVNGYTSTARYSLAKDATLYVFAGMLTPGTDKLTPVRFALKPAQGEIYTAALSAAGLTPAPDEPAAPVEDVGSDEPVKPAPVEKPWIGTSISGDGWKIDFDAKVERTCIRFAATPTAAQKAIVDAAGFYYRNDLKCFVKKLTCKAYRAAQSVAAGLKAIA